MRVPYAWNNTFHNKKRTFSAVAGIAFSVLLIFMQVGFLETGKRGSTLLYQYLDFDLIMTSDRYEFLTSSGSFDKARLIQAMVVPGVKDVMPLNIGEGEWKNPETEITSGVILIGIDPNPSFIRNTGVKSNLDTITKTRTVMLDTLSTEEYGPLKKNSEARINDVDVTVTSLFTMGMRFYNDSAVFVNNQTFQSLVRRDARMVNFGLIRVAPGADITTIKRNLKENLPDDVLIFDRQKLITNEQDYFIYVLPVGIMFQVGVIIAFIIGSVILFQVLVTEITNKLNEYATLKAMGFTTKNIYNIGFTQAFLFAFMGYMPALAITIGLFHFLRIKAKLPAEFTLGLAGFVFFITLLMCIIPGFLALQKVRKADPAELF